MWRRKKKTDDPFDAEYLEQYQARVVDAGPFEMRVEDIFTITGRGTVITGVIAKGQITAGETVTVQRHGSPVLQTRVIGIEQFRRTPTVAKAGDNVGLLLEVDRGQLQQGDSIVK